MDKRYFIVSIVFILAFSFVLSGCTVIFQKGRRSDIEKIQDLTTQLDRLSRAQRILEDRLKREIADKEVMLEKSDRGLVITFLADILFDSGKDKIKQAALATLDKVVRVLQEEVSDLDIGIEGHTDNVPIKFSGWKSNWELSSARALSVLHYLVDQKGVSPNRVSAIGYGEYKPATDNDTKEGRQRNRRVEVVILSKAYKQSGVPAAKQELMEPQENLK